jgi:hypothetical protein
MPRLLSALMLMLTLTVVALAACGGPSASLRVSEKVVAQFPPDARLSVYDAENEIIIALDLRDAARDKVASVESDIARAKSSLDAAKRRGGGDGPARARVDWHEVRRDHAELLVDVAEVRVICARAGLELAKAKLVVQFDVLGEDKKFSVKAFQKQHERCNENLAKRQSKADKLRDQAKKAEGQWRKAREDFVARTGDHDHGLWID